jgi:uncharacterized membrane protein
MSANKYRWWVGIAILVHFSIIFVLGFSRYWGYMTSINDLGQFDQAIWGGLLSKPFLNTINRSQQINWLGLHFNPILILFTPLYAIIPSVIWLIFAQSLALSIAAVPIFLLASRVLTSEKAGLFWALAYLVNPFVLNAAAWDFQAITLAVPFVAISMWSIERKNFWVLFLSCLIILSCKEHLGVMVIGFGLLWWIINKRWKTAIGIILTGVTHSVLVIGVIMPALSPTGEHYMLSEGVAGRYSWLGSSPIEALQAIFTHPFYILKKVILEMGGAVYIVLILITLLGFPLVAPEFFLPGLADLMANILSANPMPRSPFAYHSVSLIPVFTVAAVYGTERISRWTKKFSTKELAIFTVIASFIGGYFLSPFPLPGARNFWAPVHYFNLPDPKVQAIRSLVGDSTSVSAQANIGAHFSQRLRIYRYPNKVGEVAAIILRLESPTTNINKLTDQTIINRKYLIGMLDSHLQMDRVEYIASIESLLSNNEYGVSFWQDPWLVFSREASNYELHEQIKQKLNQLRKDWKISFEE